MTIKKSYLEQLWYYRITKVFLLLLPFLAALIAVLYGDIHKGDVIASVLIFTAVGWLVYVAALNVIWRVILYIVFGGLENDLKKKPDTAPRYPAVHPQRNQNATVTLSIIFTIIAIVFLAAYIASR